MSEPIHILSLGAGVQSSTLALMAAHGEVGPALFGSIFADTMAEPKSVYRWLDFLELEIAKLPHAFPTYRVSRGSLTEAITTLRERKDKKGYWVYSGIPAYNVNPDGSDGHIHRQCTVSFKIEQLDIKSKQLIDPVVFKDWKLKHKAALKELAGWKRACAAARKAKATEPSRPKEAWEECQADVLSVQWIGISLDEIVRMKPSRHPWALHRWPLVEKGMKRHDCLLWMEKHGYPKPPRSACTYCPYHSDTEWRRLRDEEPEEFAEAVRVDYEFRRLKALAGLRGVPYVHASRVPLDKVDFSTEEDHGQQVLFGNDCTGMCGN